MYYELYIDIFFFTNFMMDLIVLFSVKSILKFPGKKTKVFLGAVLGSLFTSLLVVISLPELLKTILYHCFVNIIMLKVGLKIKGIFQWVQSIALLYVSSILLGGILQLFRPYVRTGSFFFFVAAASWYLLTGCWNMLCRIKRDTQNICEVSVFQGGKMHSMRALFDTGNTLRDSVSKEPVCVIGKTAAKMLSDGKDECRQNKNRRYIPYHSVKGTGIMQVFRVEKMWVKTGKKEEWEISNPLLGISEEEVSLQGEYLMILNPDILKMNIMEVK